MCLAQYIPKSFSFWINLQAHHWFLNNNEFNININNFSNTSIATSINTTTRIIGNKKIIRTEKTKKTTNGTQTTVEEKIEII